MPLPIVPCGICTHQLLASIDAALAGKKESYTKISERFRVSRSALVRHDRRHRKPRALEAQGETEERAAKKLQSKPPATPGGKVISERQKAWARFVLEDARRGEEQDGDRSDIEIPEHLAPPRPPGATYWDLRRGVWRGPRERGVFGVTWM